MNENEIMTSEEEFAFEPADFGIEEDPDADESASDTGADGETAAETEGNTEPEDAAEAESGASTGDDNAETDTEYALEIKYNGAQQKLTKAQAVELAQKGMNYDKINGKLTQLEAEQAENKKLVGVLEGLAKAANKPLEAFVGEVSEKLRAQKVQQRATELTSAGMSKDKAAQIAAEQTDAEEKAQATSADVESMRTELIRYKAMEKAREVWSAFTAEHPDVKEYSQLPAEVQNAVKDGKELNDAYNAYEVKQLREAVKKASAKAETQKKAPGSVKSQGADDAETDPFLRGFLG